MCVFGFYPLRETVAIYVLLQYAADDPVYDANYILVMIIYYNNV